jgi:hypothetical protein
MNQGGNLRNYIRTGTDRYGFRLDPNDDANRDLADKRGHEYSIILLGGRA